MRPRRLPTILLLSTLALASSAAAAADLPDHAGGPPPFAGTRRYAGPLLGPDSRSQGSFGGQMAAPVFVGPARFDIYGHPIFGPTVGAAPSPLYASTGCPAVLEPVYDAVGNFAGYSPIPMCR